MSTDESAIFPAIVVCHDESIYILSMLSDWTDDVDQWFWSDGDEYLVDQRGRLFTQECYRGDDRRPDRIPTWRYSHDMTFTDMLLIAETNFNSIKELEVVDFPQLIDTIFPLDV